jgi:hypothetical protein
MESESRQQTKNTIRDALTRFSQGVVLRLFRFWQDVQSPINTLK